MARLARDVDLGIGGGEPPRPGVVVFSHACRVALGAHVVPVLTEARPVQLVTVGHVLARVEMQPSLPALGARPRVPGDAERREAAVTDFDEVLLDRRCAERNRSRDTPRPGNRLCRSIGCGPPSLPLASAHVPYWPSCVPTRRQRDYSNAKIRFQSFFMLMTTQLCFFAWAIKASGKVPTLDVGP